MQLCRGCGNSLTVCHFHLPFSRLHAGVVASRFNIGSHLRFPQGAGGDSTEALRAAVGGLSLAPASSTSSGAPALGGDAMQTRPQLPPSRLAPSLASAASAAVRIEEGCCHL